MMTQFIKEKLPKPFRAQGQQISYDGDDKSFCDLYSKEQMVEFAILFIKECAGIYDKIDNGNYHLGTQDYLEALRLHFGIEK